MAGAGIDPSRLYSALLNTGLQNKDPALYQVIYQLIGQVIKITATGGGSTSSGSSSTTVISSIGSPGLDGADGVDGDAGPPGLSIVGPTGAQGPVGPVVLHEDGVDGLDGLNIPVQGPQGIQGVIGPIGPPAILFVEDGLEGDPFPVPKGDKGDTGPTGIQGLPGIPIFIDDGLQGEDGFPGPPGNAAIEYGTWTPVIGGAGGTSGQTYTAQVGVYTRIKLPTGYLVIFAFRANLSVKGTITGNVEIQGLPFTSSAANINGNIPMSWSVLAVAKVFVGGLIVNSSSVISVRGNNAASVSLGTPLVTADIAATTVLAGNGLFFTD